jgi:hypothetical protein
MPLDDRQFAVFQQIDGNRCVRDGLAQAGLSPDDDATVAAARHFFGTLWRAGYALYRLPLPHAQDEVLH